MSQTLDDAIVSLASAGLTELVSPPVNAKVAGRLPEIFPLVEKEIPAGGHRECVLAGLWVLAGELDRSHQICQEIPGSLGAAWHAVVHRMEGDFWNSKYWWKRADGLHWQGFAERVRKELPAMGEVAGLFHSGRYDPAGFVDLVEAEHERADAVLRGRLLTLQRLEWMSLFEASRRGAK